jgi:hypothetical protein
LEQQVLRGEHLGERPVREQHMECMVEPVEPSNDRGPLSVRDDARSTEVADLASRNAHGDLDSWQAPFETLRMMGPGGCEVEVRRPARTLVSLPHGHDT